jgi:hypothetical protein
VLEEGMVWKLLADQHRVLEKYRTEVIKQSEEGLPSKIIPVSLIPLFKLMILTYGIPILLEPFNPFVHPRPDLAYERLRR